MPDLKVYTELKKGAIVTLSDPQTELLFGGPADFEVGETRLYTHEFFTIYAYQLRGSKEDDNLFFMVKVVDGEYDFRVYYLDHGGTQEELIEEGWFHWTEDKDAFSQQFVVEYTDEDNNVSDEVIYRQKSFGPFYKTILKRDISGTTEELVASICEYESGEDIDNPEVFIEWSGENNGGWVEVYYGAQLHYSHVEVFSSK